jgi:protein O-mannosyl-transferase
LRQDLVLASLRDTEHPPSSREIRPAQAGWGISRASDRLLIGFLILCAALPYLNTLVNGFVYDDVTQVLHNPYIRTFHHLGKILTTDVWSYRGGTAGTIPYYRPLMTLGYLLCFQAFGPSPFAFHLINIALYAAIVVLLFFVTKRMFQDRTLALLAAAAFALHPIHTEPVAWIGAVTELELTFFCLLTFWFFLALEQPDGGCSLAAQAGMVCSFALALLSKEQALTLAPLAVIYEHGYRGDRGQTTLLQKIARYRPLWLLTVANVLFRIRFLGGFVPGTGKSSFTVDEVLFCDVAFVGQYLWKLVWPARLCAYQEPYEDLGQMLPSAMGGLVGLAVLGCVFLVLWKRDRLPTFGLVWLLVTLTPVLNANWTAFAERYLCLPSIGFCWLLAWILSRLGAAISKRSQGAQRAAVGALCLIALLCAGRIVIRNRDWHDNLTFFTRTLAASPDAWPIYNELGQTYYDQGDVAAAQQQWLRAAQLAPNKVLVVTNLGLSYIALKQYDEALALLLGAVQMAPYYTEARINLGMTYAKIGENELAENQLRIALWLAPLSVRAHNRMGELYLDTGRPEDAIRQFRSSLEIEPNNPEAVAGLYRLKSVTAGGTPSSHGAP